MVHWGHSTGYALQPRATAFAAASCGVVPMNAETRHSTRGFRLDGRGAYLPHPSHCATNRATTGIYSSPQGTSNVPVVRIMSVVGRSASMMVSSHGYMSGALGQP